MRVVFLLHYAVFVLFVFLSLFLVSGVCVLQCGKNRRKTFGTQGIKYICIDIAIKGQCTL